MNQSIHPFFDEIKNNNELAREVNFAPSTLPQPYHSKNKIKAILVGADPTNNGIRSNPGLKELEFVFGINSMYEQYFFGPQIQNLSQLNLTKDDLFIQNLCRNYFKVETSKNKKWVDVATLWLKYFKEELSELDRNIPILVTAEKILKLMVPNKISAVTFYNFPNEYLPLWSESLQRNVYPLFRHLKYYLCNQPVYKNFLKLKLN